MRVYALDGLRGLAALAVLAFHYTSKFPEFFSAAKPAPFAIEFGFYGVHIFFMISGFVILMSLERSQGKGFLKSRFLRLYPLYWACVLLTFSIMTLSRDIAFDITPLEMLVNLTMLQGYARIEAVDGVYWSLTYELGFYAFMYALFRLNLQRHVAMLPVVMSAMAVAFLAIKPYIPHPLHYLLVINSYGHLFACGLAFFLLRTRGTNPFWIAAIVAAPFIQYLYDGLSGFIAVALSALLMSGAVLFWSGDKKIPGVFLWLGAISYALYLTHQMIGYALLAKLETAGLSAGLSIALTAIAALGLASLLTYGVERPAVRRLKKLFARNTKPA